VLLIDALLEQMDNACSSVAAPLRSFLTVDKPAEQPPDKEFRIGDDSLIVKDIAIPKLVADQMSKLGIPLSWYTHGDITAAIQACALDCTLVEDYNSDSFLDSLELTDEERAEQGINGDRPKYAFTACKYSVDERSFCERIENEREIRKRLCSAPG